MHVENLDISEILNVIMCLLVDLQLLIVQLGVGQEFSLSFFLLRCNDFSTALFKSVRRSVGLLNAPLRV